MEREIERERAVSVWMIWVESGQTFPFYDGRLHSKWSIKSKELVDYYAIE